MNLKLDMKIRKFLTEDEIDGCRSVSPDSVDGDVDDDYAAILSGNLRPLFERGAHPLLLMQLAHRLSIDPMEVLSRDTSRGEPGDEV